MNSGQHSETFSRISEFAILHSDLSNSGFYPKDKTQCSSKMQLVFSLKFNNENSS